MRTLVCKQKNDEHQCLEKVKIKFALFFSPVEFGVLIILIFNTSQIKLLMNIVSLKNNPGRQDYLLTEDDKTVLKLCYKNDAHIARVETEKERRVLIIEDEGLLRTLLILKNEYGVRIGSLSYDNFSVTQGVVEIENIKYRFRIHQFATPELHIYKGSYKNLIYSCQLLVENNKSKNALASLIIAVSWYLFLKGKVKTDHAFHEAIIL